MDGEEYRSKVYINLETTKPAKPDVPPAVLRATSQLRKDHSINGHRNCSNNISEIISSGNYGQLNKNQTAAIE
jgi:hypothetical protein